MFGLFKKDRKNSGTRLSLSYYDDSNKKVYEVCYESCEYNSYARVRLLDEYCDKMKMRFKRWISNEKFDSLVGYAIRNGFFTLKSLYQGDVKDNYRYVLSLKIGTRSHVVVDSFGAAPLWLRDFERIMMSECIENKNI